MDRRTLALATALTYPEYAFAGGEAAVLEQRAKPSSHGDR
jgi:hypothetical protein